eukprot:m.79500 g.79500  ORF g.79500 m.79500 type:complete len:80 (-) comp8184_c0_seq2:15-254(-)
MPFAASISSSVRPLFLRSPAARNCGLCPLPPAPTRLLTGRLYMTLDTHLLAPRILCVRLLLSFFFFSLAAALTADSCYD